MVASKEKSNLVFDYQTLRLIVGVLAFAFPAAAIAFSGKITTSISSSYWEPDARNFFVGFMFVIGALLISYKGHPQTGTGWLKYLTTYQEDVVSTIGGAAAILAALNPTAPDGVSMDAHAYVHLVGAFILFATVVYFCTIAFLRSINQKLLGHLRPEEDNDIVNQVSSDNINGFLKRVGKIREDKSRTDINLFMRLWNFLFLETSTFGILAKNEFECEKEKGVRESLKISQVFTAEVTRGRVYVVCGSIILIDLVVFILLSLTMPDFVKNSKTTFVIETFALVFFGVAWMRASQFDFWSPIKKLFQSPNTHAARAK